MKQAEVVLHIMRKCLTNVGRHPWLLLIAATIPAIWPLLRAGMTQSADGPIHLIRLALLDQHIRSGTFFPRWLPELNSGLGYPVFNFYAPLSYYVAEAFHLLGLAFDLSLNLTMALFVLAGAVGMYKLAGQVFSKGDDWPRLLAGVAYAYSPYLITNAYVRGAIAEVGAQALLPWVFWSTARLMRSDRPARGLLAFVLCLGGIVVMHNITALFLPPILLLYVAFMWWQGGRTRQGIQWFVTGGVLAAGITAFFWGPLLFERPFLSNIAYGVAARTVGENAWTWSNFLNLGFFYEHTFRVPFRLGIVQLLTAIAGLTVARRRDAHWLFYVLLALIAGLGIGYWTAPFWQGSRLLLVAQFPWRLLSYMGVALALLTGACATVHIRGRRAYYIPLALAALLIYSQAPRVDWMKVLAPKPEMVAEPAAAQFERETGAYGTSNAQEFRPRWSIGNTYEQSDADSSGPVVVSLQAADRFGVAATIDAGIGGPLRFMGFYFPGWQATLDGDTAIQAYPTTSLGLLTVDIPPGQHTIAIRWEGTPVQHVATALSLISLAVLAAVVATKCRPRLLAGVPILLFCAGTAASLIRPPVQPLIAVKAMPNAGGIQPLGARLEQVSSSGLIVRPYWFVSESPPRTWHARWQIQDAHGEDVTTIASRPYFNALGADNWPPGTLVDDAYFLRLPAGLPAGSYSIALSVQDREDGSSSRQVQVGSFTVKSGVPAARLPSHSLDLLFGTDLRLEGYDLQQGRSIAPTDSPVPVVKPGNPLALTLFWSSLTSSDENVHGFVHLVDHEGKPVAKTDQTLGSYIWPMALWGPYELIADVYRLVTPRSLTSGLYWPRVGAYHFESQEELPALDVASGDSLNDVRLPPIKILARVTARPDHRKGGQFGDFASLLGYDLVMPSGGLLPDTNLGITLYYRALGATPLDLTRFLHLSHPELGMAAQKDAQPQDGANPTWAWVPGEVVRESVSIRVSADAAPGRYTLRLGFYDPAAGGARVQVSDSAGRHVADGALPLMELEILSP